MVKDLKRSDPFFYGCIDKLHRIVDAQVSVFKMYMSVYHVSSSFFSVRVL